METPAATPVAAARAFSADPTFPPGCGPRTAVEWLATDGRTRLVRDWDSTMIHVQELRESRAV